MFRLRESLILIATCAAMTAFTLQTAQGAVITTSGTWEDVLDAGGGVNALTGVGTSVLSWGNPVGAGGDDVTKSSYTFVGVTTEPLVLPTLSSEFTTFDMGTFTHDNQPIFGPSITGTTLNVTIVLVNGDIFNGVLEFDFTHFETVNFPGVGQCAAGGAQPCPDLVSISGASPDQFFTFMDMLFQFEISFDGASSFLTLEQTTNSVTLTGTITKIPEPSTMALFGIGLAGLGFMRRRRRKAGTA